MAYSTLGLVIPLTSCFKVPMLHSSETQKKLKVGCFFSSEIKV